MNVFQQVQYAQRLIEQYRPMIESATKQREAVDRMVGPMIESAIKQRAAVDRIVGPMIESAIKQREAVDRIVGPMIESAIAERQRFADTIADLVGVCKTEIWFAESKYFYPSVTTTTTPAPESSIEYELENYDAFWYLVQQR